MKTTQNVLVVVFCSLLFVAGYVAGVTRTKTRRWVPCSLQRPQGGGAPNQN